MEAVFRRETENIYRLKVPFEALYTSVFLVQTEGGNILVDCAAAEGDAEEYIVSALEAGEFELTAGGSSKDGDLQKPLRVRLF